MLRAWLVGLVVFAGCDMGSPYPRGSRINGTPIPGCRSDEALTAAQLAAVYHGWSTRDSGYDGVEGASILVLARGVNELLHHGHAADMPMGHLGYAWHCTMYPTRSDVVRAILEDDGWQKYPAKRLELATAAAPLLEHAIETKPQKWDDKHPFTAPTFEARPDGSVTAARWISVDYCGIACFHDDVKQEITFAADGAVTVRELDRY
jgi:hypothetical protein